MGKTLVDTNIFIDIFKGNKSLEDKIFALDVAINTIIYVELIQGSKSHQEVSAIEQYLLQFENVSLDSPISLKTVELIKQYSGSKGLRLADGFIAATSIVKEYPLLTFNKSDFNFIPDLKFSTID